MSRVKDIRVKVIPSKIANNFVKKHHYSGKVVQNSSLHFGAFLDGKLHGVMSYGSPLDKRKVLPMVIDPDGKQCLWNGMLELNRMAFDDYLPKNSESRCIAISIRLLKKNAPQVKWILSFADGTQCGDGTIYRASGFKLAAIKENENTVRLPSGDVIHKMTLESSPTAKRPELGNKSYYEFTNGKYNFRAYSEFLGGEILKGYQIKYVKIIDESYSLSVPELPFDKIDEVGAGMYKGEKMERKGRNQTANSSVEPKHDNISPHTHDIESITSKKEVVNG